MKGARHNLVGQTFLSALVLLLVYSRVHASPISGDTFFNSDRPHALHLHFTPAAWQQLQPLRTRYNDTPTTQDIHQSHMGFRFPVVRTTVTCGRETLAEVGIRFKGNSSYVATSRSLRRPMLLDFNHYRDQSLEGLNQLNLNPNVLDPSHLRETLTYRFFRLAGVPAPRTALAQVTLSVDGHYDRVSLGPYTLIEDINHRFLKSRFNSEKGLLLKPEQVSNFRHIGDDFAEYEPYYRPRTPVTPELAGRLIEFSRLITRADNAQFQADLDKYLDVRAFLRFIAVNVLCANYDSILGMGHNYYIYIAPDDRRLHFIPWDVNLSFGGYVRMGEPISVARADIHRPWVGQNRLLERLFDTPAFKTIYLEELARLNEALLNPDKLNPVLADLEKQLATLAPTTQPSAKLPREAPPLGPFLRARYDSVKAQLEGRRENVVTPRFHTGPISGQLRWPPSPSP